MKKVLCIRCKVPMKQGIYIVPMWYGGRIPCFIDVELIKKPQIKICLKCPKCGYSETD